MPQKNTTQPPAWFREIDTQYQYLGWIGHGGIAEVHYVLHRGWNLEMAVKSPLLESEPHWNRLRLEYFEREATAWSDLVKHPNIVTCFYVREIDQLPRIFMEYIPGGTLSKRIREGKTSDLKVALDIGIQICEGMSHAARQLVHRDLKPDNILITRDGIAMVSDFNLAWVWEKATAEIEASLPSQPEGARSHTFVSKPYPYRSPEHGTDRGHDTRMDIWGFAILFWEMLTASRPDDGIEAPTFIAEGFDRRKRRGFPNSLLEILLECVAPLEKRTPDFLALKERLLEIYHEVAGAPYPRRSPPAAQLFAADYNNRALSQLDLNDAASAREYWKKALQEDNAYLPAVFNYGLFRWRKGLITDAELVETLELLAQDALSTGYIHFLMAQVHLARGDPVRAEFHLSQVPDALSRSAEFNSVRGVAAFNRGDFRGARGAFEEALKQSPHRRSDMFALAYCYSKLGDVEKAVEIVSWLDLTMEAGPAEGNVGDSGGHERSHIQGDVLQRLERIQPFCITYHGEVKVPSRVNSVRFVPGQNRLIVGTDDALGLIELDAAPPAYRPLGSCDEPVSHVVEPVLDGRVLFSDSSGRLYLWDLQDDGARFTLTDDGQEPCRALAVRYDGKLAVSGEEPRRGVAYARVWDLDSRRCIERIECAMGCLGAGFLDDERTVIVLDGRGEVCRYRLGHGFVGKPVRPFPDADPESLVLSRDRTRALSATTFYPTEWWNLSTGENERTVAVGGPLVRLSSNEDWVLGSSYKGPALANLSSGMVVHTLPIYGFRYDLSPDSQWIAADAGKSIRLCRVTGLDAPHLEPDIPYVLSKPQPAYISIESSRAFKQRILTAQDSLSRGHWTRAYDGVRAAQRIPGFERHLEVFDILTALASRGRRIGVRMAWTSRVLTWRGRTVQCAAFHPSPNVPRAISSGWDGTFRIWDVESGLPIYTSGRLSSIVEAAALTLDGRALVGAGGGLVEYDLVKGTLSRIRQGGEILQIQGNLTFREINVSWAFSRDGVFALRLGELGSLECWDTCKRQLLWQRQARTRDWVVLDPSASLAVTSGDPMRLWDVVKGQFLGVYPLEGCVPQRICFSPDGSYLAVAGKDGSLTLWEWDRVCCVHRFAATRQYPHSLAFSPDGQWLLTGSNTDLTLWNIEQEDPAFRLSGYIGEVMCVDLSADGRRAISATWAGELFVWEFDWEIDFPHAGHR